MFDLDVVGVPIEEAGVLPCPMAVISKCGPCHSAVIFVSAHVLCIAIEWIISHKALIQETGFTWGGISSDLGGFDILMICAVLGWINVIH